MGIVIDLDTTDNAISNLGDWLLGDETSSYTENAGATSVLGHASITSPNDLFVFPRAVHEIRIAINNFNGTEALSLSSDTPNLTWAFNSTTGVLTIKPSGGDPGDATWTTALNKLQYSDASNDGPAAVRSLTVTGYDENGGWDTSTVTVNVARINDAPVMPDDASVDYITQGSTVHLLSSASVFDPDNPSNFDGGSLTATIDNAQAGDVLKLDLPPGFTVSTFLVPDGNIFGQVIFQGLIPWAYISSGGVDQTSITFKFTAWAGAATPERVDVLLNALGFSSTSNSTDARTVSITLDDGGKVGSGGAKTDTTVVTINADHTADVGGDLAVAITPDLINDAGKDAVAFTISGLDADATATVIFTSTGGGTVTASGIAANGDATVDLSALADGVVTASISADDDDGNTATGAGDTATLDTDADVSDDLAATFGDDLVNNAEQSAVILTVVGLDADATAQVVLTDGLGATKTVSVVNGDNSVDLTGLADGAITATIEATDTAQNTATGTGDSTMLDSDADVGDDLAVTLADTLVNDAEKTSVSYTVAGLDGDATANVVFKDANGGSVSALGVSANGAHVINLAALADGPVTVSIEATDTAQNTAAGAGGALTLDTIAATPGVSLANDSGASASDLVTNDAALTLSGVESGATVEYSVNGGGWSGVVSGLQQGGNTVEVRQTDLAGNVSAPGSIAFTYDTIAPDLSVGTQGSLTNSTAQTIEGSGEIGAVIRVMDGSTVLGQGVVDGDGQWSIGVILSGDGDHFLSVSATDLAGNTSTDTTGNGFDLDTTPPLVTITSEGGPTSDFTPLLEGTGEPGAIIEIHDGKYTVGVTTVGQDGLWALDVDLDGAGGHNLVAHAYDAAGNMGLSNPVLFSILNPNAGAEDPLVLLDEAFRNIMRYEVNDAYRPQVDALADQVNDGDLSLDEAIDVIVDWADGTTAVATLAYQFFTDKVPTAAGLDFLVAPQGANPDNLNSGYYAHFNIDSRYINFAVNLGLAGEGAPEFHDHYGDMSLQDATKAIYLEIFGFAADDAKVDALLNGLVADGLGGQMTRETYLRQLGGDELGTKAAMAGWLLSYAATADEGVYAQANEAFLSDIADGGQYHVDIVGVYIPADG